MTRILFLACFGLLATTAQADITITFDEGAPKDRFDITNAGACDLVGLDVTIDLAGSTAGLIFDVTGSGPGVEVFQAFEIVAGQQYVEGLPEVADGDTTVVLRLDSLASGQAFAFTIDVDDTGGGREITVENSEIRGATVHVGTSKGTFSGAFGDTAEALVPINGCSA